MATLTPKQLEYVRREVMRQTRKGLSAVEWTKPEIDAAAQAVEDFFVANRAALRTALNTATGAGGYKFNMVQARTLVSIVMGVRFRFDIQGKEGDGRNRGGKS